MRRPVTRHEWEWRKFHVPMILRSLPHMPSRTIAAMYGVSHKWLKKWLRQNRPNLKRRRAT